MTGTLCAEYPLNSGIFAMSSSEMAIGGNYAKSATGYRLGLNMNNSNMACNKADNCTVGIDLVVELLRSWGVTHGGGGDYARTNFFDNMGTGTYDMRLYQSDRGYNKWALPGTTDPRIDYSLAYGSGSIIVNESSSPCGEVYPEMMLGGGGNENSFESLPEGEVHPLDQNMQWLMDYARQAEQNQTDALVPVVENSFIPDLLQLENSLSSFNFDAANEYFNQLQPVHTFESNYYEVYKVSLAYRPEEPRKLYPDEVAVLTKIAQQTPWEAGPAVFIARAILKFKENMDFADGFPAPEFKDSYKTDETNPTEIATLIKVYPNPGRNELFVTGLEGMANYTITDMQGRQILWGNLNLKGKIDIRSISTGIYALNLVNLDGNSLFRTLWVKE
jgi:hypothetical protein